MGRNETLFNVFSVAGQDSAARKGTEILILYVFLLYFFKGVIGNFREFLVLSFFTVSEDQTLSFDGA